MGQQVSSQDFYHSYTEEPHASRRKEILKKHPEIKTLFGHDPMLAVWCLLMVAFQIVSLFGVYHYLSWSQTIILSYFIGGTVNHCLMLGIHEISHSLAFGYTRPWANRAIGMIANLPLGFPVSATFKFYHTQHHKFQGVRGKDVDIPTNMEAKLFCTSFGKTIWLILQPVFYSFRPILLRPKSPTTLEALNLVVQLCFDALIIYYFNVRTFMYLFCGTILSMGLHPIAGHFISDHYVFNKGNETYSYYGPLNYIGFNAGYHNEHHDFPFIPGSRLPMVRKIASEYYDSLPCHHSWTKVIYDFITDPNVGLYARTVREKAYSSTHEQDLKPIQRIKQG